MPKADEKTVIGQFKQDEKQAAMQVKKLQVEQANYKALLEDFKTAFTNEMMCRYDICRAITSSPDETWGEWFKNGIVSAGKTVFQLGAAIGGVALATKLGVENTPGLTGMLRTGIQVICELWGEKERQQILQRSKEFLELVEDKIDKDDDIKKRFRDIAELLSIRFCLQISHLNSGKQGVDRFAIFFADAIVRSISLPGNKTELARLRKDFCIDDLKKTIIKMALSIDEKDPLYIKNKITIKIKANGSEEWSLQGMILHSAAVILHAQNHIVFIRTGITKPNKYPPQVVVERPAGMKQSQDSNVDAMVCSFLGKEITDSKIEEAEFIRQKKANDAKGAELYLAQQKPHRNELTMQQCMVKLNTPINLSRPLADKTALLQRIKSNEEKLVDLFNKVGLQPTIKPVQIGNKTLVELQCAADTSSTALAKQLEIFNQLWLITAKPSLEEKVMPKTSADLHAENIKEFINEVKKLIQFDYWNQWYSKTAIEEKIQIFIDEMNGFINDLNLSDEQKAQVLFIYISLLPTSNANDLPANWSLFQGFWWLLDVGWSRELKMKSFFIIYLYDLAEKHRGIIFPNQTPAEMLVSIQLGPDEQYRLVDTNAQQNIAKLETELREEKLAHVKTKAVVAKLETALQKSEPDDAIKLKVAIKDMATIFGEYKADQDALKAGYEREQKALASKAGGLDTKITKAERPVRPPRPANGPAALMGIVGLMPAKQGGDKQAAPNNANQLAVQPPPLPAAAPANHL